MSLRRILDDREAMSRGDSGDSVHVGRLAAEVDRDDRPRPRTDRSLDPVGVDVPGGLGGVDPDRPGARRGDGEPGRDPGVGGDDHLVARTDPAPAEGELDGAEPAGDADAVPSPAVVGEGALERLELGPQQKPARVDGPRQRRIELAADLGVAGDDVGERHRVGFGDSRHSMLGTPRVPHSSCDW